MRKSAAETKLYFYDGDKMLRDLFVCVDFENPEYTAYYDMRSFLGTDIKIVCENYEFETSDCKVYDDETDIRPQYHFTAKRGWMNDPNGIAYYEGRYHMFYQYNPIGTARGSEHWGHSFFIK